MIDISTEPLLTPVQLEGMQEEHDRLQSMLNAPPHIRNVVQDVPQIRKQLRNLKQQLERSTPRPFASDELDEAVRLEREMREQIVSGMCTQREMRAAPPGAVDKHRMWQQTQKENVLKWKNLRRRLHASGALTTSLPDATDVANIEMFRPRSHSGEMSMDNSITPTKDIYIPPSTHPVAVMNDEDSKKLKDLDPELHDAMATLTNEQRAAVLAIVRGQKVENLRPKKKRAMSPEAKEAARQRMLAYHAQKKAEKENGGRSDDNDPGEQREQAGPEADE